MKFFTHPAKTGSSRHPRKHTNILIWRVTGAFHGGGTSHFEERGVGTSGGSSPRKGFLLLCSCSDENEFYIPIVEIPKALNG
ncbi:hypothetical protein VIGAN_02187800, partial [Vigna angularis var. angularis]